MADWWLGNLDDTWFHALEDAVRDEWAVEPLRIREGGVRSVFACLPRSDTDGLPAVHSLHSVLGEGVCLSRPPPPARAEHGMYICVDDGLRFAG